jgi:hypothetical protein
LRVALSAPPFIAVSPKEHGGTELFVGQLAKGLRKLDADIVLYANGESTTQAELRWL